MDADEDNAQEKASNETCMQEMMRDTMIIRIAQSQMMKSYIKSSKGKLMEVSDHKCKSGLGYHSKGKLDWSGKRISFVCGDVLEPLSKKAFVVSAEDKPTEELDEIIEDDALAAYFAEMNRVALG